MRLIVNGEAESLDVATLTELLCRLDYQGPWLATAVNGELVHREERALFPLTDGDRIEILSPMQGG